MYFRKLVLNQSLTMSVMLNFNYIIKGERMNNSASIYSNLFKTYCNAVRLVYVVSKEI